MLCADWLSALHTLWRTLKWGWPRLFPFYVIHLSLGLTPFGHFRRLLLVPQCCSDKALIVILSKKWKIIIITENFNDCSQKKTTTHLDVCAKGSFQPPAGKVRGILVSFHRECSTEKEIFWLFSKWAVDWLCAKHKKPMICSSDVKNLLLFCFVCLLRSTKSDASDFFWDSSENTQLAKLRIGPKGRKKTMFWDEDDPKVGNERQHVGYPTQKCQKIGTNMNLFPSGRMTKATGNAARFLRKNKTL